MSTTYTTTIPETDCIGDSLATINNNFDSLGTVAVNLSSSTLALSAKQINNYTNSATVNLQFNSTTQTLSATINNSSITSGMIAPGTITSSNINTSSFQISATQIVGYSKGFKKFKFSYGDKGSSSYYRSNSFISNNNRLYVAGYGGGYTFGGTDAKYADNGFHQVTLPLTLGEYVSEHYMTGGGNPSMYVLTNQGNLYSIGYNGYGQLGDGTTTDRKIWYKINLTNVTHFSCSTSQTDTNHCLAVSNGQLYAWGQNWYGQLGDNSTTSRSTPTLINTGGITGKTITKCFAFGDDYTSYAYSYVIDNTKAVYATGNNGAGQLGQGNTTSLQIFTVVPTRTADYVLGGSWNSNGTTYLVDGTALWTCGYNGYGQLGDGTTIDKSTFFQSPAIAALAISSLAVGGYARSSVVAILTNKTVRTWGYNGDGQLGNGGTSNITSPYTPSVTSAVKARVQGGQNSNSSYILDSNGDIWAAGINGYGQLGNGTTDTLTTFTKIIRDNNIIFVDFDTWGMAGVTGFTAADINGDLYSCGYNAQHSCGIPYTNNSTVTVIQRATIQ